MENWISWTDELKRNDAFYILVGSKYDLSDEREVSIQEGLEWAKAHNVPYFEVSAKTNKNIEGLFDYCVKKCYNTFGHEEE